MDSKPAMIKVAAVEKSFRSTVALDGVDITVGEGTIFGLLGRNGAGKTTLVRIVATLLRPDSGEVLVAGADVERKPQLVRSLIGYSGQHSAIDGMLTGRENLELIGRLYGMRRPVARQRAEEVLHRLSLSAVADQLALTYSGGMLRRLDLGASLIGRPLVLIMDEPTTGLDPRSRMEVWNLIDDLVREGTTLLLTSQYLEEVDRLADRIAVIDRGRVIAEGSPDELKERTGGDVLEVRPVHAADLSRISQLVQGLGSAAPVVDRRTQRVTLPIGERVPALTAATRLIEESGIPVDDLGVRRPSLDDVFLLLTSGDIHETRKVA